MLEILLLILNFTGVDQIPEQIIIDQDGKQFVYEQTEVIDTENTPEFGTISAVILAVAIISIIAISARSRLNVLPKY